MSRPQVRFTLLRADRLPMIADRDAEAVVRGSEEIMADLGIKLAMKAFPKNAKL